MIAKIPMKITAVTHTITTVDELSVWKKERNNTHAHTHTHDYLISTLFLHILVGFGWGLPVLCRGEYEYDFPVVKGETV